MYPNYSKANLPTWIIGASLENTLNAPAYILKGWPKREKENLSDAWDPMNLISNFSGFRNPIVYETFRGFVHRTPIT
jgi:hypothetical protein